MSEEKPKLCINCKYCMGEFMMKKCRHSSAVWASSVSLVDGTYSKDYQPCKYNREDSPEEMPRNLCGTKAVYFEQREITWFEKVLTTLFGPKYR